MLRALRRLGLAALLGAALFVSLPALLMVNEPLPERADAIFVFAGQVPDRALCAARLFSQGVAPKLVLTGGNVRPELVVVGQPLSDAAINAKIATDAGVPANALAVIPSGTSTWEEAGLLRGWIAENRARKLVAISSPTHSRRARRALRLALRPLGAEVRMISCGSHYTLSSGWWLKERPLIEVANEALKLALYTFRYFIPVSLRLLPPP